MALLFTDGFEDHDSSSSANFANDVITTKEIKGVFYSACNETYTLIPSTGKTRTAQNGVTAKSLFLDRSVCVLTMPTVSTVYIGFGFYPNGSPSSTHAICGFAKDANHGYTSNPNNGVRLSIASDRTLVLINNNSGATIATSTLTLPIQAWSYIEIKYVFGSGTSGAVQVKVDDTDYINVSSINSACTATSINTFYFQAVTNGFNYYYDDFYICDDTGSANNTFLGPISVYTAVPTANSSVEMTASAGSNYACVDELPYNTTDYVTASANNKTDLYTFSALPAGVTPTAIPGVLIKAKSMKPTANSGQVQMVTNYSGNTSTGTAKIVTQTSWCGNGDVFETQPNGSAWDSTAQAGMAAGVKVP